MKWEIRIKSIVISLSLLSSFIPMSFYYISSGTLIIRMLRGLRIVLIIYYLMRLAKRGFISKRLSKILLFLGSLLLSSILYGGVITGFLENVSIILIVFLMMERYVYCGDETEGFNSLKCIYTYFFVMMLVNAVSMVVLPEGIHRVVYEKDLWHELSYPVYFLNTKNRLIEFEMPLAVLTAIMYEKKMIGKIGAILSVGLIIFTVLRVMSMTSIAGICASAILLLVIRQRNIGTRHLILYPIIFFAQIVFEAVMTSSGILALLGFLFGRVGTILSRYALAQQAVEVISQNFLMGVGAAMSGRLFAEGSIMYWVHNHALDTLVQSGSVGFVLFLNNLIKPGVRRKCSLNNVQKIIFAGMIGMLFMGMTESFIYSIEFYLILSMTDI